METRFSAFQSRLDQSDDLMKQLQLENAETRAIAVDSKAAVERIEATVGEILKIIGKRPVDDGGSVFSSSGRGPRIPSTDGLPWAVKKVKLPEFYGFDPRGWLQKAKLFFEINATPLPLCLRLAQLSMVGVAQHWFTVVLQVHPDISWEQFEIELLQRFSGLDIQNPFEQLAAIRQSHSILDYIDDFEYLLSLVPRLPESQAIGYFVAGLRDDVKQWVHLHRPQSRLAAMHLAKDMEAILHPVPGGAAQSRFRYQQLGSSGGSFPDRAFPMGHSTNRALSGPKPFDRQYTGRPVLWDCHRLHRRCSLRLHPCLVTAAFDS